MIALFFGVFLLIYYFSILIEEKSVDIQNLQLNQEKFLYEKSLFFNQNPLSEISLLSYFHLKKVDIKNVIKVAEKDMHYNLDGQIPSYQSKKQKNKSKVKVSSIAFFCPVTDFKALCSFLGDVGITVKYIVLWDNELYSDFVFSTLPIEKKRGGLQVKEGANLKVEGDKSRELENLMVYVCSNDD